MFFHYVTKSIWNTEAKSTQNLVKFKYNQAIK